MNTIEYVENYLEKKINNNTSFVDLIKVYNLERLFIDKLKNKDNKLYHETEERIKWQKEMFMVMKEEIKSLSNLFKKNNVDLIHLKGVSLAADIYEDCPEIRKSGDIDILVAPCQIKMALNLLGSQGYFVRDTGEPVSEKLIEKYYDTVLEQAIHFPEFLKETEVGGKIYFIDMDCHISILHILNNKERYMNDMVCRRVEQNLDDTVIQVLDIHDRILHLALHLTKEFLRNYVRWSANGVRIIDKKRRFPLPLLHDIALLIEKYRDEIDWELIEKRADELGALDEYLFIVSLINVIYGNCIPAKVWLKQGEDNKNAWYTIKRFGQLYPLDLLYDSGDKVLEMDLKAMAKYLLEKSEREKEGLCIIDKIYVSDKNENSYVLGCQLQKSCENACYSLTFPENLFCHKNFEFILEYRNGRKINNEIRFVIGSSCENELSEAYINLFTVNLKDLDWKSRGSVVIENAYAHIQLKSAAHVFADGVKVSIPWPVVGTGIMDRGYFLFDLEIPELFNDKAVTDENKIKKYSLLSSTFPYSPNLLTKITF